MQYRILAVGDVVGQSGVQHLRKHLRAVQRHFGINFTVVNGENAQMVGLAQEDAEEIFAAGADVVTLGNHAFGKPKIASYLDDCPYILRPANLGERAAGRGYGVFGCGQIEIAVLCLLGRVDMNRLCDDPFRAGNGIGPDNGLASAAVRGKTVVVGGPAQLHKGVSLDLSGRKR